MVQSVRSGMLFAALSVLCGGVCFADGSDAWWASEPMSCHWIGSVKGGVTSQSAYDEGSYPIPSEAWADWTNRNNWAEGIVPGRIAVPQADGTVQTNGSSGCVAVFDGDSKIRVVRVKGLVSVGAIRVTGASAPRIVFGETQWRDPNLYIESGGKIEVAAEVPEAPYFMSMISPFEVPSVADQTILTLENNSPGAMDVGYVGDIFPAFTSNVGLERICVKGTGTIRKRNRTGTSNWGVKLCLEQDGGRYVANASTNLVFASSDNVESLSVDASAVRQHIEIPEGKAMNIGQSSAFDSMNGDLVVDGDGILYFSPNSEGYLSAGAGRTLEVACNVVLKTESLDLTVGKSGRTGTVKLSGKNTFAKLSVGNAATCEVSRIDFAGVASGVGLDSISLGGRGALRYAGAGETTDRALVGDGYGVVEVASDGDLVWKGEIKPWTVGSLLYSFTISTPKKGRFVIASSSVTKFLNLASGAKVGFAKPDGSDKISVSKMNIEGAATLCVPSGVEVDIAALTRSSNGSLDIILADGGSISIAGFDGTAMPEWITIGGRSAYRADDGSLYSAKILANSVEISAHGDQVPNAPLAAVGITSAEGTGDDSLATSSVSVLALNHEVAESVTVAMSEGETLDARLVRIKSGAGNITIGDQVGVGEVKASADALVLETSGSTQRLTLNAKLANPASVPLVTSGPGTVRLSSAGTAMGVDAIELSGDGTFDLSGGTFRLVESGTNGVVAKVETSSAAHIDVFGGSLTLSGETDLPLDKAIVGPGELVLAGPRISASSAEIDSDDSVNPPVSLEVGTTNQVGVLRVEGGSFTGRLEVASYGSANVRGAVYQSGGEVVCVTRYNTTPVIGAYGYAYYELLGGRYVAAGGWSVGNAGEGILTVAGGELYHPPASVRKSRFRLGKSLGRTQLLVGRDGTFNATNIVEEALVFPDYGSSDSWGQITVENGGRLLGSVKGISLATGKGTEEAASVVNLNKGGEIAAGCIFRNASYVYSTTEWPEGTASDAAYTNACAYVNCNGGTFKCQAWGWIFGERNTWYAYPPNRVTLYEDGLTVDSAGKGGGLGLGGGLTAPSGLGVVSVSWTDEDAAWFEEQGMVGPPIVRIVGDGRGATAVADYDSTSGRVSAIRVTGFGNDYTEASAQLIWNRVVRRTLPCTLAACKSGGLTKIGSGYLNLCETNTYTGATVVRGGTLRLKCDGAISSASTLVLEGGELDLDGHSQTFADIVCSGGTVSNGKPLVSGLEIDFDNVRSGVVRTLDASLFDYVPGAKLKVRNMKDSDFTTDVRRYRLVRFVNGAPAEGVLDLSEVQTSLPERWIVRLQGGVMSIMRPAGLVIMVR